MPKVFLVVKIFTWKIEITFEQWYYVIFHGRADAYHKLQVVVPTTCPRKLYLVRSMATSVYTRVLTHIASLIPF
jgi:hypothetical protein